MARHARWSLCTVLIIIALFALRGQALATIDFFDYRVPATVSCKANRDLELLWSSTYLNQFGVNPATSGDLDQFGITIADTYKNPFNFPMTDIQLVHDFEVLRHPSPPYPDSVYQTDCSNPIGFRINQPTYPDAERSRIETYLYVPPFPGYAGDDPTGDGRWPAYSQFTPDPDGLPLNSISVPAGKPSEIGVSGPNAWYRPDGPANSVWDHEFQHCLNAFGTRYGEMYSSIAQVIGGAANTPNPFDVPYTWSLLSSVLGDYGQNNYYAFESLGAYIAFGFRGADTTFAGRSGNLLWRWAMSTPANGTPDLTSLGDQLVDARCPDCAAKFPAGVTSGPDRREVLVHDYRVFNYVDNPSLAQGQYGIPPNFGPSPSRRLGFWKDNDGCCWDNTVALPPETTLTSTTTKVVVTSTRTYSCSSDPCNHAPLTVTALDEYGAEYWIVRSDASLNQAGNGLVIHVEPTATPPSGLADRMMVSVVGYSNTSENGVRTALWTRPQWAQTVVGPQWIDVRSQPCGAVDLTLPNFGTTNKAALVVITLGSSGPYAAGENTSVQPFKITMTVQPAVACTPPAPTLLMGSTTYDERGAFSPAGNAVVFTHFTPGAGDGRIFRQLLDGSPASQLVPGTPAGPQADPDWSPRGDLVCYEQDQPDSDNTHLWVYNVQTGGNPVQLTTSNRWEVFPAFSPNGQEIAYVHAFAYGSDVWELRRMHVDGTSNTLVYASHFLSLGWPHWSPDGSLLYFERGDSLFAVNVSGGQPVFIPKVVPPFQSFDLPLGTGPILTNQLLCSAPHVALQDTVLQTLKLPFDQPGKETHYPRWAYDGIRVLYTLATHGGDGDLYYGVTSCDHAPVMSAASKADVQLDLCTTYNRYLSATDADGDPITYQAFYLPPGATFSGNRFRWTPSQDQALMTFYVVFRALDNKGGLDNAVVQITTTDVCQIQCPRPPNCYPTSQQPAGNDDLPKTFALRQSTPNPFVDRATIGFDLPAASYVTLSIYDLQGRRVRKLVDQHYAAGRWSATWDRIDDAGKRASSGVYFYRAQLGTFVSQKKMLIVQ